MRTTRTGLTTTVIYGEIGGSRHGYRVLTADRASDPGHRILSMYVNNVYYTDLNTFTVTSAAAAVKFRSPRSIAVMNSRHVQTVKTGVRMWDILLSYPTLPGKAYVMAVGASGVRPGLQLADGRHLSFNLDTLALLTLNNFLPAIFSPGPGLLDLNGEARGSLNLSSLTPLNIPIWIQALVLDPVAPIGIAVVEDPYVMRI